MTEFKSLSSYNVGDRLCYAVECPWDSTIDDLLGWYKGAIVFIDGKEWVVDKIEYKPKMGVIKKGEVIGFMVERLEDWYWV